MDDADLLAILTRVNTWWSGDEVPGSLLKAEHRRRDFFMIRERLLAGNRQIMALRGPRQVGKTTICGQLIDSMLREFEVPPDNILYLTIENANILSEPSGVIEDALEIYRKSILQSDFREVDGDMFVFIDEVQKSPDWADTLKYYTDTYSNIQFFATGSVSTLIKEGAGDTLIGRLDDRIMLPMKFVDRIRYEEILDENEIYDESTELRSSLERAAKENDPVNLTGPLSRFFGLYGDVEPQLTALKNSYLLKGGYPSVIDESIPVAYEMLDTDLRNTVTGDVANVFEVGKPRKLLKLLNLISESSGNKINKSNLAESADISRQTVNKYLNHLDDFFLINRCPKYRSSEFASGGWDKIYLQDVGVYNTLSGRMSESILENPNEMGPILETTVCDHSRRLQFYLSGARNADIYYWDKKREVDFVIRGHDYTIPIEVKHGNSTERDLSGLRAFIQENDLSFGLCVNNAGVLEKDGNIIHIPSWIYLFLC